MSSPCRLTRQRASATPSIDTTLRFITLVLLLSRIQFLLHFQRFFHLLGPTQHSRLISLGKNARPPVLAIKERITSATHIQTQPGTHLTTTTDTSLVPIRVTSTGRRHPLPCSWRGRQHSHFSVFRRTHQYGPPWPTTYLTSLWCIWCFIFNPHEP